MKALAAFLGAQRAALAAVEAGAPAARVPVFPVGVVKTRDGRGPWVVDETAFALINNRFQTDYAAKGIDVVFDFNHDSEKWDGSTGARASGWISGFELDGGAIYARVAWTPEGEQALRDKSYRYISPAFMLRAFADGDDKAAEVVVRPVEITSCALVTQPAFALVVPFTPEGEETEYAPLAKRAPAAVVETATLPKEQQHQCAAFTHPKNAAPAVDEHTQNSGNPEPTETNMALDRKALCATLGLPETASDDEIQGAVRANKMNADHGATAAERLAKLEAEVAEKAAVAKVDALVAEGKITAAERPEMLALAKAAPAQFDAMAAKLTRKVPVTAASQTPAVPATELPPGNAPLTDAQREMNARAGIDDAAYTRLAGLKTVSMKVKERPPEAARA